MTGSSGSGKMRNGYLLGSASFPMPGVPFYGTQHFECFGLLAPQISQMFGSLSLKNWHCLPGPAGPPIASRSASEPRERRHRSRQKQRPAPGGAQDRLAVGAPWFSGPAGAVALVGRDRGRSQSLAAARLTLSAPSGSESAPLAMRNFGSFGSRAADFSARAQEWKP